MNSNQKLENLQRRIKTQTEQVGTFGFFNLLTSPEMLSKVEQLQPEYRERKYPPTETLSMFLSQAMSADRSCQNIVNIKALQGSICGLNKVSTQTGSYCKARKRLPLTMVSELTRHTSQLIGEQLPTAWRWQGRKVKLVDGTTITMPDTPENQAVYPQQGGQKPGLGFPICRVVSVVCLASGSIVDSAIGPYKGKGADEHTLLRSMLDSLTTDDILVGDAYYSSYFLWAELMARGVDAVFEQSGGRKRTMDFRKGKSLGRYDHIVTYPKPRKKPDWMAEEDYLRYPEELSIREIKIGHKILATTLLSAGQTTKQSLKNLYKDRWNIELDFRNIKTTMGMEVFSCKTPEMVRKEMWAYLLAYNLIRLVMVQSAILADILPRQLSFKHSLQIWLAYNQMAVHDEHENLKVVCLLIVENTVGHRPGRIEPREVKKRPKEYKLLTIPRGEQKKRLRQFGHEKRKK